MRIFNGEKEAEKILLDLKKKTKKLKTKPGLAVLLVGDNPESKLYLKLKRKAAKRIGMRFVEYRFKKEGKEKEIIEQIESLNKKASLHGILVQLPLPARFNTDKIVGEISLKKDVDGFQKRTQFVSPLISAILIALKAASRNFKGKRALALVNSSLLGQRLRKFLKKERITIEYLLREKVSKGKIKEADIIISVCGSPGLIKGDMIKDGAVLIDAGFKHLSLKKVRGDVDRESLKEKASFLTPVPGGIGPLTVALLLKNVYLAAKKYGSS